MLVGLLVMAACISLSTILPPLIPQREPGFIVREGLIILGWVANWRPIEIFLYDWWPLVRRRKLFERLSQSPVRVQPH